MVQGLTKEQAHRVLEDFETASLSLRLLTNVMENIGRDIRGMLNGNFDKENVNGESSSPSK